MRIDAMEYVLNQLETATKAIQNAWDFVNDELYSTGKAIYVKTGDIACFVEHDKAYKVIENFGEGCKFEKMGNMDLIVIYKEDEKVNVDGESYLLGNYLVMKADECGVPYVISLKEFDQAMEAIASRLVPFMINSVKTEAFQL